MFKSLTLISVVATAAWAQSSIPQGISDGCRTFLTNLNTDSQLTACTSALSGALSAFAPGSSATASASTVTSALTNVCSDGVQSSCPSNVIGQKLTEFYTACSAELTSNPNPDVAAMYDVLYTLTPMRQAICSKGDDGNWCVMSTSPPSGTTVDSVQAALYTQNNGAVTPNTNTFSTYNVPFLFITPDSPNLCQSCTRNVLNAYITHESNIPHAQGLGKSTLLKSQADLFSAVQSKCGASFMDNEVKAAGGLSSGPRILGSGAVPQVNAELQSLMAAFAGFATLAVTAIL